jgi:hypothetical protein
MVAGVIIQTGQSVVKLVAVEQEKKFVPAPTLLLHTMETLAREKARR